VVTQSGVIFGTVRITSTSTESLALEEQEMKPRIYAAVLLTAILAAPTVVWGCSAAGPNKHIGMLMNVDAATNTFTMLDAETNQPITFSADKAIIESLNNAIGMIHVDFVSEGTKLRAIDVQY
jgi:hypothetical protein